MVETATSWLSNSLHQNTTINPTIHLILFVTKTTVPVSLSGSSYCRRGLWESFLLLYFKSFCVLVGRPNYVKTVACAEVVKLADTPS